MTSPPTISEAPPALGAAVGNEQTNAAGDVLWVKQALRNLGRYNPQREALPIIDRSLLEAVRRYQHDRGLRQEGVLRPGGPTECCLRVECARVARRALP